ncbi:putative aconitase subunit 2 [Candidatus Nitrososphaera evergladensis SR1]|uniref:Putative aconitase subunit 2 n=2 Tax=Nitrososphaera TaxID=497726 RepID=A0A075MUE4_9ARCH|nr:putative aconitase subunit 2 [Candidatus Nitrososphaera evergladensis SR1]
MITGCRRIVGGKGEGEALVSSQPINFLAMVEAKSGRITDPKHKLYGKSLKDTVLVFPNAVGSSVGAYVFYSLKEAGTAPKAIVCAKADITTASGCAIANIPVVDLPEKSSSLVSLVRPGSRIKVDADAGQIATV